MHGSVLNSSNALKQTLVFLRHQLCVPKVICEKPRFLFAHTNNTTLLTFVPKALDFHVLAPATIF